MTRRLLLLNGLATLGVVLNHSTGWGYVIMFWWADRFRAVASVPNFDQLGGLTYYALRFAEQAITPTIPAFIFVSGFFVAFAAGKAPANVKPSFVINRITLLVIPYLLWSVITLALDYAQGFVFTPSEYLRLLLLGQSTPAFYFVPLLVQLYVLAPLLAPLARDRWPLLLAGAGLLQAAALGTEYVSLLATDFPGRAALRLLTPGWFFPGYIFWFAFGLAAGFHQPALKTLLARYRWPILAVAAVLVPLGVMEWEALQRFSGQAWLTPKVTPLDTIYSGAVLLSFLAFEKVSYPAHKAIAELGAKSYGVYLVHSLALTFVARGIYHAAPGLLAYQIIMQPVLIAGGLAIPLLLMALVKRSPARRLYAYQFG